MMLTLRILQMKSGARFSPIVILRDRHEASLDDLEELAQLICKDLALQLTRDSFVLMVLGSVRSAHQCDLTWNNNAFSIEPTSPLRNKKDLIDLYIPDSVLVVDADRKNS